ncbi:homeobox domain protein [Ancylostoma duodenale]|uniref:Homeobox domain protein n=1 Tax=Ancylostoma duodenale TaxID=51022 RepID=A0A0C2G103_9BILA|nr:homeobox domain protein [Ancylostoma duodenale]
MYEYERRISIEWCIQTINDLNWRRYSDISWLPYLDTEFCTSTFVTSERKAELSSLLNLTERQIKIWFQNR